LATTDRPHPSGIADGSQARLEVAAEAERKKLELAKAKALQARSPPPPSHRPLPCFFAGVPLRRLL
jgi:hypothetical protein